MVYKIEIIELFLKLLRLKLKIILKLKMKWNGCITMKKWY